MLATPTNMIPKSVDRGGNMKTMNWLLIALFSMAPIAHAGDCAKYISAATIWEDQLDDGQIVQKNTQSDFRDWDPNDDFDVVMLKSDASKTLKNPILEVQYLSKNKAKKKFETFKEAKDFEQDPSLKTFSDFDAHSFFKLRQAGTYTIKLKDGDAVLCTETHSFKLGH